MKTTYTSLSLSQGRLLGLITLVSLAVVSCQDSNLVGDNKKPGVKSPTDGPGPNDDDFKKDDDFKANPGDPGKNGEQSDLNYDEGKNCYKKMPQLYFLFAIDATGSMSGSINSVINNVGSFATKVTTLKPEGSDKPFESPQFGAITYGDSESENRYVKFGKAADAFATQLKTHLNGRPGGGDACEGGLQAAKNGIVGLQNVLKTKGPSLPILILISDNYSHTGTAARDISNDQLVTAATGTGMKSIMIFDAVPSGALGGGIGPRGMGGDQCASKMAGKAPSFQWEDARAQIAAKSGRTAAQVGNSLGFNGDFNSSQLLVEIPKLISDSVKICK